MSWVLDPKERRVARCIEGDHPRWYVIWGVYSRIYSAFPLFDGPPGTIIKARDARELIALMREAEIASGPQRYPRIPGSRGLPPARQHDAQLERLVPYEEDAPVPYKEDAPVPYEEDAPVPFEEDAPVDYGEDALVPSYEDEPARPEAGWPEPEWPAPGDPDSWPSEELAFLPSEPDTDWPEEDEAAAGAVTRGRGFARYRAARRGQR